MGGYQLNRTIKQISHGFSQIGDDRGHLIADMFDGPGDWANLVAMDGSVNKGMYKSLELAWKAALEAGKTVSVNIRPKYSGFSWRPVEFLIKYVIEGEAFTKIIPNIAP